MVGIVAPPYLWLLVRIRPNDIVGKLILKVLEMACLLIKKALYVLGAERLLALLLVSV